MAGPGSFRRAARSAAYPAIVSVTSVSMHDRDDRDERDESKTAAAAPSPIADTPVTEQVSPTVEPLPPGHRVDEHGVPAGVRIAAAWSWRLLSVAAAGGAVAWGMRYMSAVIVPVVVGVLLTALLIPVTNGLERLRLPRGWASGVTVLATVALVAGLLTLVGTQIR